MVFEKTKKNKEGRVKVENKKTKYL